MLRKRDDVVLYQDERYFAAFPAAFGAAVAEDSPQVFGKSESTGCLYAPWGGSVRRSSDDGGGQGVPDRDPSDDDELNGLRRKHTEAEHDRKRDSGRNSDRGSGGRHDRARSGSSPRDEGSDDHHRDDPHDGERFFPLRFEKHAEQEPNDRELDGCSHRGDDDRALEAELEKHGDPNGHSDEGQGSGDYYGRIQIQHAPSIFSRGAGVSAIGR